jgi:hypothetical protein
MANWNPESFSGKMFRVTGQHAPPPAGIPPPVLWGDDATVRARLGANFTRIETQIVRVDFDMPVGPAGAVAFFRRYFGPTQMAFARLDEAGQVALAAALEALWASENVAPQAESRTLIHNEFLQVLATRK